MDVVVGGSKFGGEEVLKRALSDEGFGLPIWAQL